MINESTLKSLTMPYETRQALPTPYKGEGKWRGYNHLKHK